MKHLFLIIVASLLLFKVSFTQVPSWGWAAAVGGTSDDMATCISTDPSGNVYATGHFQGNLDFDPGPGVTTLSGIGIFVSKLDAAGNLVWAKGIGGFSLDYHVANSIAVDPQSKAVYITGFFEGTLDFDPGAGLANLIATGNNDVFICKLDSLGNFAWAKKMGGGFLDQGKSIAVDLSGTGSVYTTGEFAGTVDFDPGSGIFNLTSMNFSPDIFIVKLDSAGNFIWAKGMGGTGFDLPNSIVLDPSGNGAVYTTGQFSGTSDFDPGSGTFNLVSAGSNDIFISKLDTGGNFIWAKALGGAGFDDYGMAIAIDTANNGEVYTTGRFQQTVDFDPGAGIYNLTALAFTDIFISKLDSAGNFIRAAAIGGTGTSGGHSISLDPSGNGRMFTTGFYSGTADFDPGPGVFNLTSAGQYDIFILQLDSACNLQWAKTAGGSDDDIGLSVAASTQEQLFICGKFRSGSPAFGTLNLTGAGGDDVFIARLDSTSITAINNTEPTDDLVLVYPNPASTQLFIDVGKAGSRSAICVTDITGKEIYKLNTDDRNITLNVAVFPQGMYLLEIRRGDEAYVRKLILMR